MQMQIILERLVDAYVCLVLSTMHHQTLNLQLQIVLIAHSSQQNRPSIYFYPFTLIIFPTSWCLSSLGVDDQRSC